MNLQRPPLTYIPSTITNPAFFVFVLAIVCVNLLFSTYALLPHWWVFAFVEVGAFMFGISVLSKKHQITTEKQFAKTIFWTALIIRIVYVLFMYWFNFHMCGDALGYEAGDAKFYNEIGQEGANWMRNGDFNLFNFLRQEYLFGTNIKSGIQFSDIGFPIYVAIVYFLSNDSILVLRLLNCIWSALTVLLLYRLAKRNFSETIARMAAIMVMLWPNFWYYCGTNLKETLMVFLTILFIEKADALLRTGKFTLAPVFGLICIDFYLFMIRTPLAATLVLALLCTLVLSNKKTIAWRKRILVSIISVLFLGVMVLQNSNISSDVQRLAEENSSGQKANMEWRSTRKDASGNVQKFAKYAGAAIFAPMIFTLPFPTFTEGTGDQEVQRMASGGNFCKNLTSFFTILALFSLLFSGDWRRCVLPIAILCGYLIILAFSEFAQSERFHQPIMPFAFLFAAYGISKFKQKRKFRSWYYIWLGAMFVAAIAWNWFKLAGRGLV